MARVGVLCSGLAGATANTLVTSIMASVATGQSVTGCLTGREPYAGADLVSLDDLAFGGWDVVGESVLDSALRHGILPKALIDAAALQIGKLRPFRAFQNPSCDPPLLKDGDNVLRQISLREAHSQIRHDIEHFRRTTDCKRTVVILLGPPLRDDPSILTQLRCIKTLDAAIDADEHGLISSALLYASAAIEAGCAVIDFTANRTLEVKSLLDLAIERRVPLAGRDGSTGQTFLKACVAHLLSLRGLTLNAWYSTNILGNQDGFVLTQADFRSVKLDDKRALLREKYAVPDSAHVVDISYFPPRGDNKESWDSVDFSGWFDLGMQLKLNWLGRDSILAGPLLLDLVRWMDWELRAGSSGIQAQLGFYFKRPLGVESMSPPYDQFRELTRHYATLSRAGSEEWGAGL